MRVCKVFFELSRKEERKYFNGVRISNKEDELEDVDEGDEGKIGAEGNPAGKRKEVFTAVLGIGKSSSTGIWFNLLPKSRKVPLDTRSSSNCVARLSPATGTVAPALLPAGSRVFVNPVKRKNKDES